MENGLLTGVALLDFSAAFDLVDHDLLLLKLKDYNFSEGAIDWIKSYLTGRISMVNINGEFSSPTKIVCGVPQGSCLGPISQGYRGFFGSNSSKSTKLGPDVAHTILFLFLVGAKVDTPPRTILLAKSNIAATGVKNQL
jgi:hypothetical protein